MNLRDKFISLLIGLCAVAGTAPQSYAWDDSLTPLGAERAGNPDGSIPAWTGGTTSSPTGYVPGQLHPNPFSADKEILAISQENVEAHQAFLSVGQKALFATLPTFRMNVYPSRRSAAFPQHVYDATKANAERARLSADGYTISGARTGIPFPVPKQGIEVIWNHLLRYRGEKFSRRVSQAAVTAGGRYNLVRSEEKFYFPYSAAAGETEQNSNALLFLRQHFIAPARLAGTHVLVHETINKLSDPRQSWLYNPGERRIRRAPFIQYDTPAGTSDGLRVFDQFDMYNGLPDRYDWELLGKRELYVPYNSYGLEDSRLDFGKVLGTGHVNPDPLRYEKHRVWVVDARLKSDASHLYSRRTFYLDEDSWQILLVEAYDKSGDLWRVSEGHPINFYEVPTINTVLEVHYDLKAHRYLAMNLHFDTSSYDFTESYAASDFNPDELRRAGIR